MTLTQYTHKNCNSQRRFSTGFNSRKIGFIRSTNILSRIAHYLICITI